MSMPARSSAIGVLGMAATAGSHASHPASARPMTKRAMSTPAADTAAPRLAEATTSAAPESRRI
ncbi:hypothetical protein D9M73_133280 [compost metagenome]